MKKNSYYLLLPVVFICLMSFFMVAHPLYMFDMDDWGYAIFHRRAIPNIYEWNPTRILPEVLYPFCAKIAAYIIYPFNNDILSAVNIITATVLSASIVVYLYLFYKLCNRILKADSKLSIIATFLFLISHFVLLDVEKISGNYLFWAHDVCCVYYYTIPSILNVILIFLFIINKYEKNEHDKYYLGMMIVLVYLAINSNLYQSGILIIFIVSSMLFSLINNKKDLKEIIVSNKSNLLLVIIWGIGVVLEAIGPRSKASWLGVSNSLIDNILESFSILVSMLAGINKFYIPLILLALVSFIYMVIKKDREYLVLIGEIFVSSVIYFLFLGIINSKVSPDYNSRVDVTYGLWFYIIFGVSISILMLIKNIDKIIYVLPLYILILTNECVGNISSYNNYNITNLQSGMVYEIDQNIISSIIKASEDNVSEITIHVPQFSSNPERNWPLSVSVGDKISNCLYAYNIINRKVNVVIIPDESLNEKYDVQINDK